MRHIHMKLAAVLALVLALLVCVSLAENSGQTAPTPLEIIRQPEGQSAFEGQKVSTRVQARGDGLTYQWYLAKANSEFTKSSLTSASYGFEMSEKGDGRLVYCVITDQYGNSIASDTVQFTMKRRLEILSVQQNATAGKGQTASITVHARGDGLTYQWFSKNKKTTLAVKIPLNAPTYSITMNAECADRQVYCVVRDQYGNSEKTETITLRLPNDSHILTQPADGVFSLNQTARFSVEATGDGLQYQWYAASGSQFVKTGTNSPEYTFNMTKSKHGLRVYCVISDCYGRSITSDTATAVLDTSLYIVQQPVSVKVLIGEKASVSVQVEGEELAYQWWYKNAGDDKFHKASFTGDTYTVTMTEERNGRKIYCEVTDKYGVSIRSDTVTLSSQPPIAITRQPQSVSAFEGERAVVSVEATGDGLTYQWYICARDFEEFELSSVTGPSYGPTMSEKSDGRRAYCLITDQYGETVKTDIITFRMATRLEITKQPVNATVPENENATVTVEAKGDELTYTWWCKKTGDKAFSAASATSPAYTVTMNMALSGCKVYCEVTDKYGVSIRSDTVTLTCQPPIVITRQPQSVSAVEGERAVVSVEATGDGLTYQWYICARDFEEFELSSVTGPSYGPTMSEKSDGRKAYCLITDQYGKSVTTDTVVFTMRTAAQILKQPVSAGAAPNEKVTVQVEAAGDDLTYTWWYKNAGDQVFSPASVTSPIYTVTMTQARNGRQLCCDISDPYGVYLTTDVVTIYMIDGLKVDKKGAVTDYTGKEIHLVLPQQFGEHTLTSIAKNAAKGHKTLVSVTLPASVTEIGAKAFANCPALERVDIPASVEKIGKGALLGCSKLQVICDKDSAAAHYCEENNIPYTLRNK